VAEAARAEAEARAREADARAREAEADARRAEAEERDADDGSAGVPLWLGGSGVILGPGGRRSHGCVGGDCRPVHGRDGHGGSSAPPRVAPPPKPQPLVGAARSGRNDGGSERPRP
jgi:hypothetical protein